MKIRKPKWDRALYCFYCIIFFGVPLIIRIIISEGVRQAFDDK